MKQQLRSNFKQAKGFTLIELIIVIIILGILAVTAAPKFIDIQGDARKSVRLGIIAGLKSSFVMANAKAAVKGVKDGEVEINGTFITFKNGYPSLAAAASADGTTGKGFNLLELIDLDSVTSDKTRTDTSGPIKLSLASDCTIEITASPGVGNPPEIGGLTTCGS